MQGVADDASYRAPVNVAQRRGGGGNALLLRLSICFGGWVGEAAKKTLSSRG